MSLFQKKLEAARARSAQIMPAAMAAVREMLIAAMAKKVIGWLEEKEGRRFVAENDGEEGFSFYFEESGEKVAPDFMGGP